MYLEELFGLKGKVALVTGGGQGIGQVVALGLARVGAKVVIMNRTNVEDTVRMIEQEGGTAMGVKGDVTSEADVDAAIAKVFEAYGSLDIVFNNAGICAYAKVDEMTDEEWDTMIGINLTGAFKVTRAVVPTMKLQKSGVIINNSSVMGLRGGNRLSHYVASKWGLTGFTKSLAIELAPFGIRAVSIHPTGVNTPMNDGLAAMEGKTPEEIAEASAGNLQPVPWVEVEDVANLVMFLASDKARYCDGGQYLLDAGLLSV